MDELRLGALLLEGGIVDEAGLERCLAIQALTGSARPIGQILVEQGLLDEDALKRLLDIQRDRVEAKVTNVPPTSLASAALLAAATANRASEIVVSEGRTVRIRVGTTWRSLTDSTLSGPEVWDFVRETMGSEVLEQLAEHHFVVRPWKIENVGRGTAMAFRQFNGVAVRVSFSATEAMTAAALGVPAAVSDAVRLGKGLVLVVGERGIGRGALLSSLVQVAANDATQYVVIVDDDPVSLPDSEAILVRRRFGFTPAERAESLRNVVREDPDTLVIADVGSPETFEVALRAAEGGRLVIAWIDAASVVAALIRIMNFYPVYDLPRVRSSVAAVLRVVMARYVLPDAKHAGTVPATELLIVDDAVREVVRKGELSDLGILLRAEGGRCGHSLDRSMLDLLTAGTVRMEDVFARTEEKAWLLERTRNLATESR